MKSLFRGSAVIAATIFASSLLLSATPSVAETLLSSFQKSTEEPGQGGKQDPKQDPAGLVASSNPASTADPNA